MNTFVIAADHRLAISFPPPFEILAENPLATCALDRRLAGHRDSLCLTLRRRSASRIECSTNSDWSYRWLI